MWFVSISVGVLVAVLLSRLRVSAAWRTTMIMLFIVVCLVGVLVLGYSPGIRMGGGLSWYDRPPSKEGIVLVVMLLGMGGKYLFDAIERRRRKVQDGDPTAGLEFDRWEFVQPFVVSFIVFGAFWSTHGNEELSMNNLVISFQNGFFWQTVLKK